MPRKVRFNLIGVPQHVIQQGNNREPCFYHENDYLEYLHGLELAENKYDCRIHAYVLMTNHVHMLVTPMDENTISEMIQSIGSRYVRYMNKKYNRTGTLWEGRYKSSLVDSENYLLRCMQYIELNPVRAKMLEHPAEYQWSSYRANAQGEVNELIEKHPTYLKLGTDAEKRCQVYIKGFNQVVNVELLQEIREALNHELVLGSSYFKDRIERITERQARLGTPGRPKIEEMRANYIV